MKRAIIFLTVLIFMVSFAIGCKSSEVEELKEQVAELSEKLAEEESVDQVEEVEVVGGEEEAILVLWNEAKFHIGEMATVYGPVVATFYDEAVDEGITFLNIGKDYPDPEGFSVWIDKYNRPNFFKAPERYYYEKNISVTGVIVEIEGLPHMEITDPDQISINEEVEEAVEEPVEEEPEEQSVEEVVEETVAESTIEEETQEQPVEEVVEEPVEEIGVAPTIRLEIIEGPAFSQLGDNTCYYRVKAHVTGDPSPAISFNKDDSLGSLGANISQVNLHSKGESFTLEATAVNSQGSASDSITLSHTCQDHIPILVKNDTGGTLSLSISGPATYNFSIPPGHQNIYVVPGTYNYTGKGCGGGVLSGTYDLLKAGDEWDWWCQ